MEDTIDCDYPFVSYFVDFDRLVDLDLPCFDDFSKIN